MFLTEAPEFSGKRALHFMVCEADRFKRLVVVQVVAGSIPVAYPYA